MESVSTDYAFMYFGCEEEKERDIVYEGGTGWWRA